MKIGDRVCVNPKTCTKYRNTYIYRRLPTGIVNRISSSCDTPIGVQFIGVRNPNGTSGLFWFRESDLTILTACDSHDELSEQVPEYLHADIKITESIPEIENVIFNNPATIVLWADGTKTVVKCSENDIYDPEKGLSMAFSKKLFGNKGKYYEMFTKWIPKETEDVGATTDYVNALAEACNDMIRKPLMSLLGVFHD